MSVDILELIKREKWEIVSQGGVKQVKVYGRLFPLTHPVQIHLAIYRKETNPELKYFHMKAAHDYLWPKTEWHYWTERRFREHCNGWNYIGWAGGASTTKSYDAAKILLLFWFANPKRRTVVVASTTLESVAARVWGYCTNLINAMAVKLPFQYLGGQAPKILYPADKAAGDIKDTIHGIFAIAAKTGDDDKAISSTIGRHPDEALMVVLDECTDLNPAIAKAFPNLDSSEKPFQLVAIGNSNSLFDLHGSICTPKAGWGSIDPLQDTMWMTTQKNGICLFFSCYESPAVHENDVEKRKRLGRFLITSEQIKEKEVLLGKDSDLFYRFVLGFWKSTSTDTVVVSKEFLDNHFVRTQAEWLGIHPLKIVGGLDPAFSTGGDKCILRLGILGQTIDGGVVLDFRDKRFLFEIKIKARSDKSAELQIAEQVCDILINEGCALGDVAIDSNGQGRAIGGTLYLEMKSRIGQLKEPLKIYSTKGGSNVVNSFGMIIKTTLELWSDMRNFIEHNQIKGLDVIAATQLSHRWIIQDSTTLRKRLESKAEFKKRMGAVMPSMAHSPDEADSAVLCLMSAIHNYGFSLGERRDLPMVKTFAHEKLIEHNARVQQVVMVEESTWRPSADFSGTLSDLAESRKPF
jgi:hypothetical protein